MIVADTGAVIALIDADDSNHQELRGLFEKDPAVWILPWAILPELDYLLTRHFRPEVELQFLQDLAEGRWIVDWGDPSDLDRVASLCRTYQDLQLGLTDGVVIATAERLKADAIATVDLRDFAAVEIRGMPKLLPRDSG